jgi:hypothetical protein
MNGKEKWNLVNWYFFLLFLMFEPVLQIRIRTDLHHFAVSGFGILEADPDPSLQNWHLINLFSVE